MHTYSQWPWPRSLALADPGALVQVEKILFDTIRDRCAEFGMHEGSTIVCNEHGDGWVELALPSGETRRLSRSYAWFIAVSDGA